jgi:hypothetical protein
MPGSRWVMVAAASAVAVGILEVGSRPPTRPPEAAPPPLVSPDFVRQIHAGDLVRYEQDGVSLVWQVQGKAPVDARSLYLRRGDYLVLVDAAEVTLAD